jgi:hypothetical protein
MHDPTVAATSTIRPELPAAAASIAGVLRCPARPTFASAISQHRPLVSPLAVASSRMDGRRAARAPTGDMPRTGPTRSGESPRYRPCWRSRRESSSSHWCWRCGPGSGRATSCDCHGRHMIATFTGHSLKDVEAILDAAVTFSLPKRRCSNRPRTPVNCRMRCDIACRIVSHVPVMVLVSA